MRCPCLTCRLEDEVKDLRARVALLERGTPVIPTERLTLQEVRRAVSSEYCIPQRDIDSEKRSRPIVTARHVAMYLARRLLQMSYPEIAKAFGGRDHATAMHAVYRIEQQLPEDPTLRGEVQRITFALGVPLEESEEEVG
jgi:chromosomal replication initiation ATPase DnaA